MICFAQAYYSAYEQNGEKSSFFILCLSKKQFRDLHSELMESSYIDSKSTVTAPPLYTCIHPEKIEHFWAREVTF